MTELATTTPAPAFDYSRLPAPQAGLAQQVELRIKTRTAHCVIENGLDLIAVKQALGHGQFLAWLEAWFPFTARTAQDWMNAAQEYAGKNELSSHLGAKVMTLLARPSTPVVVRQVVEDRALAGETMTTAEVQRLIAEAKASAAAEAADRAAAELKARQDAVDRMGKALSGQEDVVRALRDRITEAENAARQAKADGRAEAETKAQADLDRLRREADRVRAEAKVQTITQAKVIASVRSCRLVK